MPPAHPDGHQSCLCGAAALSGETGRYKPGGVGALREAFRGREDEVAVSFPLRHTPLFSKVLEVVRSGALGTINQIQAVNNVPYGGVYFGQWYRNHDQTGGLWLQKATHDFDCINLLAGSRPVGLAAMESRRVYGGGKPHDLRCSACDETETCPESPQNLARRGDDGGMYQDSDDRSDHWCAFSSEIRNHDAGSALIMYENGIHASYSQNFLSRRSAYKRGATVIGYEAPSSSTWPRWNYASSTIVPRRSRVQVDVETTARRRRPDPRRKLP